MKILYLTSANIDEASAPANHVKDAVTALSKNHSVELWHSRTRVRTYEKANRSHKEKSFYFPAFRGGWKWFEYIVAKGISRLKEEPDVLYLRFNPSKRLADTLKRMKFYKVMEVNGLEVAKDRGFTAMAELVDMILVSSETARMKLIEAHPKIKNKIKIHSNIGVNPDIFHPYEPNAVRDEFGFLHEAELILHVSGFQAHHDFDGLIHAFEKVSSKRSRAQLIIAGDGPRRAEILAKTLRSPARESINLIGPINQENLPRLISAVDICVNPMTLKKLKECGNLNAQKTYEYLACGSAVIESISPEHPLPSWAKEHLICIPAEEPDHLFAAIDDVLNEEKNRDFSFKLSGDYVVEHFSWDTVTARTMNLIQDAMCDRAFSK